MKRCPECESTYTDGAQHCIYDGAALVSAPEAPDPLVGCLLGERFRLTEVIGRGGMGSVYAGTQEPVGRPVAVKVLHPDLAGDKDAVQRFFHEARVVSRLRHPNTVTLYDFGQAESGELYIAMEFLSGQTLEQRMVEAPLDLDELIEVLDQVCHSLAEAHEQGVVHRDLKPDNIFIDRVAGRNLVKVLDFGIAKVSEGPRLTQTGMVFGTPAFMSPEQAQGFKLDARSDVYALGVTLYWLLSAQLPFRAESPMQLALKHVTDRPTPIRKVSRYQPLPMSLVALVTDMLEKEPARRPQSVDEVRRRLRAVARELEEARAGAVPIAESSERVPTFREPWSMESGETAATPPSPPSDDLDGWSSTEPGSFRGATRWLFAVAGLVLLVGTGAVVLRDVWGVDKEGGAVSGAAGDGSATRVEESDAIGVASREEGAPSPLRAGSGEAWAQVTAAAVEEVREALDSALVTGAASAVALSAERARLEAETRAAERGDGEPVEGATATRPERTRHAREAALDEEARAAAVRVREREAAELEAAERLANERAEREQAGGDAETEEREDEPPRRGLMEPVLVP